MELDEIRKELDKLDRSLDYIILLRLSLAILVGEVKEEQNMPIYQSAREEKIFRSQVLFSEQTGADSELLERIFKNLITATIQIEENKKRYQLDFSETDMKFIEDELYETNQVLIDFITHMDLVKEALLRKDINGEKLLASLSNFYRNILNEGKNKL